MRTEYKTAKVIHVKHMLYTALRQWRVWLVCAAAFAILLGARGYILKQREAEKMAEKPDVEQKEITVTQEGFYRVKAVTEFEDTLKKQQEYNNNSILMKIDPIHKWGCTIRYVFQAKDENTDISAVSAAYLEKISDQQAFMEINNALTEQTEESYLREAITLDASQAGSIAVHISYFNEEGINEIVASLNQYVAGLATEMQKGYGNFRLEVHVGEVKETVDMQLNAQQNQNQAQLVTAQDNLITRMAALEGNEPAYLQLYREARTQEGYEEGQTLVQEIPVDKKEIKVSLWAVKKQIVLGGMVGFAVGIVLLCLKYTYSRRILNAKNIEEMYQVPVLGYVRKTASLELEAEMAAVKLALRNEEAGKQRNFVLTGTLSGEKYQGYFQTIQEAFNNQGVGSKVVGNIISSPKEYKKLAMADAVILVEKMGESRFEEFGRLIALCEDGDRPVDGVIVME